AGALVHRERARRVPALAVDEPEVREHRRHAPPLTERLPGRERALEALLGLVELVPREMDVAELERLRRDPPSRPARLVGLEGLPVEADRAVVVPDVEQRRRERG